MLGRNVKGNEIKESETVKGLRSWECPECGSEQIEIDIRRNEIYCQDCNHSEVYEVKIKEV